MVRAKIQTLGFKTAVHKTMNNVTDAMSITYIVYGNDRSSVVRAEQRRYEIEGQV